MYPEDESINSKALGTDSCLSFSCGSCLYLDRLLLRFFSIMEATRNFYVFSVNFPSLVLFVSSFCSALIKAHKLKLRLAFLRKCMSEQVLPKSILPRRILRLAERPFEEFHRIILKKHIEITQVEVKEAFSILRRRRYSFFQAIPV